mmetsp:Transcript_8109/g.18128  ORF Transcript_8109/g.18128 Transcript_8109/m.18128 type:complete len:87 (-) Transcript_8109:710-970(-)
MVPGGGAGNKDKGGANGEPPLLRGDAPQDRTPRADLDLLGRSLVIVRWVEGPTLMQSSTPPVPASTSKPYLRLLLVAPTSGTASGI